MAGFGVKCVATAVTAAVVASAAVPALGAATDLLRLRQDVPVRLDELGTISSFTPTIQDARLSSAYAKAVMGSNARSFRFTPTSGSVSGRRSITILVRADRKALAGSPLDLQPLAFNLDASRGWRKFALPDSTGRKPLDPVVPDLGSARNFSLDSGGTSRLKANVQLDAHRDVGSAPQTLAGEPKYSVDLGSSYSLTRNLNVTAGVRYAGPDNRLAPLTDQRQDNQAVYVGTIFRF